MESFNLIWIEIAEDGCAQELASLQGDLANRFEAPSC